MPTPCTLISTILPSSRGLKKYNDDYPIMQDLCISGVLSDKGFPIICTPKPNKFKINAASLITKLYLNNDSNKERLNKFSGFVVESNINLLRNVA